LDGSGYQAAGAAVEEAVEEAAVVATGVVGLLVAPETAGDGFVGRRRKAQYLPSNVGTMLTTSQPSADFFVNSVASASGLESYGLNATYSYICSG
jgi:hypothetical protein